LPTITVQRKAMFRPAAGVAAPTLVTQIQYGYESPTTSCWSNSMASRWRETNWEDI